MEKLIAPCGINCAECKALQATLSNDDKMRSKVAAEWSKEYHADIKPENINCTGCLGEGVHFSHCNECEIRSCATGKGHRTCAECSDFACEKLEQLFGFVPSATENLISLR